MGIPPAKHKNACVFVQHHTKFRNSYNVLLIAKTSIDSWNKQARFWFVLQCNKNWNKSSDYRLLYQRSDSCLQSLHVKVMEKKGGVMTLRNAIIQLNWILNGEKRFKQKKRDVFLNFIWNEMDIQLDSSNKKNIWKGKKAVQEDALT